MPSAARVRRTTLVVCLVGTLSACSWTDSLKQREAVAHFARDASPEQRAAARSACLDLPHATPEPIATDPLSVRAKTDVRFRVDDASDYELGRLYDCLRAHGAVSVDDHLINNNGGA